MNKKDTKDTQVNQGQSDAFAMASEPYFKIIYLFPHEKQNLSDASHFGWYTPGILATAIPMQDACRLPADIREAHTSLEAVLLHRLRGAIWPHLLPIEIGSLEQSLNIIPSPFIICVTTDAKTAQTTDEILKRREIPVLHVSAIRGQGRKSQKDFNLEGICEFVRKIINSLAKDQKYVDFVRDCRRTLSDAPQRKLKKHPLHLGRHNITYPNEIALAAFGYKFPVTKQISQQFQISGIRSAKYIERICESADAVTAERSKLLKNYAIHLEDNRAIIAVASSYANLYRKWKELLQKVPEEHRRDFKHAINFIVRSTTYNYDIKIGPDGPLNFPPLARAVALQLGLDLRAFTAALSMLSSATLCPVFRLEPNLNSIRIEAAELGRCVRAAGVHHGWKESRMVRLMGKKMRSSINAEFLKRIEKPESSTIEGLKLITDLPLELMPSNGIPLGLRFDTSRISPLPGNMFWQLCNSPPIRIRQNSFFDILIIRSFDSSDPIRNFLQKAVESVERVTGFKNVKYRFVDVESSAQFVKTVNEHRSAVMIFDGHGKYDTKYGYGSLVVGGKILDTWALKRECALPPVVMFSACDTQPIDGSHGSVATSAFALGAHAVLGTMLPVNARDSAILMARMLLRIDQFLPIAAKHSPIMTWRHVVSGMLRMSHVAEASRMLNSRAQLGLNIEDLATIQMESNIAINSWNPKWHEKWIEEIAKASSQKNSEIREMLDRNVGLTDAMKYIQLGNPERIIIH